MRAITPTEWTMMLNTIKEHIDAPISDVERAYLEEHKISEQNYKRFKQNTYNNINAANTRNVYDVLNDIWGEDYGNFFRDVERYPQRIINVVNVGDPEWLVWEVAETTPTSVAMDLYFLNPREEELEGLGVATDRKKLIEEALNDIKIANSY